MITMHHFFKRSVARRIATALLGIFLLTISAILAQGDRSERLQERVTISNERLDISRNNTPPPITSMAQQALRKAQDRVEHAKAKLAEANAGLAEARKRVHDRGTDQMIAQNETRVKAASIKLDTACIQLREAKEAARLEGQR
jgi:hypothetical protein